MAARDEGAVGGGSRQRLRAAGRRQTDGNLARGRPGRIWYRTSAAPSPRHSQRRPGPHADAARRQLRRAGLPPRRRHSLRTHSCTPIAAQPGHASSDGRHAADDADPVITGPAAGPGNRSQLAACISESCRGPAIDIARTPGRRPALRHPPRNDDRRAISRPLGLDEPADIRQGDQRSPGFPGRLAPDTRVIVAQPPEWKAVTITLVSLRYARPGCMGSHEHPIGGISTSSVRVLGRPAAGTIQPIASRSRPAAGRSAGAAVSHQWRGLPGLGVHPAGGRPCASSGPALVQLVRAGDLVAGRGHRPR